MLKNLSSLVRLYQSHQLLITIDRYVYLSLPIIFILESNGENYTPSLRVMLIHIDILLKQNVQINGINRYTHKASAISRYRQRNNSNRLLRLIRHSLYSRPIALLALIAKCLPLLDKYSGWKCKCLPNALIIGIGGR